MRHRKVQQIRKYSQRLRMRHFAELIAAQEQKYGDYFLNGRQQPLPIGQEKPVQEEEETPEEEEEEVQENKKQVLDDENLEGEEEGDFSVADYIQFLSPAELKAFKQDNPQLPPLFFMTKAEKKKYFESLNKNFHSQMAKLPQRKSKTKKILKFNTEFQVKHFNEKQNVVALKKGKELREKYHQQIHFS